MRKSLYLILLLSVICPVLLAQPVLYMSPDAQQVDVGTEFDVDISLRDVPGGTEPEDVMKSFSVTVGFDPALLEVLLLTEGNFLSAFGSTLSFSTFDNSAGTAQFDDALLSTPFAHGSGVLFTIRFRSKAAGTVNLVYNDKDLRNGDNQPLVFDSETGVVFSGNANLYLDPNHTLLGGAGDECTIDVKIQNAFNIRGIKIILTFDPVLVEVVSVTNGTFMKPPGYNTFADHIIRDGQVEYNESIISPANVGAQGEGVMFSVTFRALANGNSPVAFKTTGGDYEKIRLTDAENQILDYTNEDGDIEIGPIAIELCAFTANRPGNYVQLEWTTAYEVNTIGFFVHRANSDGVYKRIHDDMILARGNSMQAVNYKYTDMDELADDVTYKLEEICSDGLSHFHGPISISQVTVVNEDKSPYDHLLLSNYPNPFNPSTIICYQVAKHSNVQLTIADAQGHIVRMLRHGYQAAGRYEVVWNGTNENGDRVASGLYFYTLKTENNTVHGKMLLVK